MDPRSQRKQREYEARRQEILGAAECLFSKHGFFKTSMAEIAHNAQFAMGTVYRFFKSKEEIYISLVEAKVEELSETLEREISAAHSATDKITALIRVKLSYADRNRDFFRIYVSEWKLYMNQVDLVAELIRADIQKGEFRLVDPKDAAFALHGMLNSTIVCLDSPS